MCLAPCQFSVDKAEYNKILTAAISYINDPSKLIPKLTQKMHFLSEELRFEEAQKIKLQIETLKMLMPTSSVDLANNDNYDLITISEGEECACVIRFFIRDGKLISSSHTFIDYFDSDKNLFDIHEAYTQAIFDFYADETPNNINEVVVPIILDDKDWLISSIKSKSSKTVKITKATGDKEALCKIALRNGYELLKNKKNEDRALYFELKSFFDLVSTPFRIEAFDNSHMSAQACVASMIVWEGKFDKNSYRKYHLESTSEYTQMKEVLTRRAKNFLELPPPDMWLIDGGKANYDLAVDIINSSGANVEVLAIAKEKRDAKSVRSKSKAEDKIVCKNGVIKLPNHDPKLLFLQKLRDEAHRFAIEFHRKQKLKEDKTIKMLQIKGIKEGKLKKLLNFFGSFETIANAQKEQIENILGAKDAELIVNYFTNNNHADVK
jgi:excinuclease ABC subunit C